MSAVPYGAVLRLQTQLDDPLHDRDDSVGLTLINPDFCVVVDEVLSLDGKTDLPDSYECVFCVSWAVAEDCDDMSCHVIFLRWDSHRLYSERTSRNDIASFEAVSARMASCDSE